MRFCDSATKLVVLKVPREYCCHVRSILTLLTVINKRRVSITVDSIHGSGRTAKVQTIRKIKRIWRKALLTSREDTELTNFDDQNKNNKRTLSRKEVDLFCRSMENSLTDIVNIGF